MLFRLLALFTFFFISGTLAYAEDEVVDIESLKEILDKRDEHQFVHAKVLQTKELPSLAEPLITQGSVWMVPQKGFRWELGQPVTDFAILKDDDVYVYDKRDFTYDKHDASSRRVRPIMLLLGMGKDASFNGLLDNFKPVMSETSGSEYTISFLPDSGTMKRVLEGLSIRFDLKSSFPKEVVWEQKDGTVITTNFINPQFTPFTADEIFALPTESYAKK